MENFIDLSQEQKAIYEEHVIKLTEEFTEELRERLPYAMLQIAVLDGTLQALLAELDKLAVALTTEATRVDKERSTLTDRT